MDNFDDISRETQEEPVEEQPSAELKCEACCQAVQANSELCPHCGSLLRNFKQCPQCSERVRSSARMCRFCRYDFVADPLNPAMIAQQQQMDQVIREVYADPLGAMVCEWIPTNLFRPPMLRMTGREIVVGRWSWFGLRHYEQKVSLNRVASVRTHHGIIWSSLVIETLGGSIDDLLLSGLNKREAEDLARTVEQYTLHRQTSSAY